MDHICAHLCVDMQTLFAEQTSWHAPWLKRTLPAIEELAQMMAAQTIFTRFIPPRTPEEAHGGWRQYYERWPDMVGEKLPPGFVELVPELARFVPPARLLDKPVYSPWWSGELHRALRQDGVTALVISGGETDVCVLATLMGAIDLGYHVYLPRDGVFGSADATHDAMLDIYTSRFGTQLTVTTVEDFLRLWSLN
jgi:Amidases related to nicotinamidase